MKSKKLFLGLLVLGAIIGGFLGSFDGSGAPMGIVSGAFVAALLFALILLLSLRREKNPFASIEDEERRAHKSMTSQETHSPVTNVTQVAEQERLRLPPFHR